MSVDRMNGRDASATVFGEEPGERCRSIDAGFGASGDLALSFRDEAGRPVRYLVHRAVVVELVDQLWGLGFRPSAGSSPTHDELRAARDESEAYASHLEHVVAYLLRSNGVK